MSHHPRPTGIFPPSGTGSSFRQPSSTHSNPSQQQSSALSARVQAKREELDNLKQLRDQSAVLATHMQGMEDKLKTLRDGTEAVAHVLENWGNVLKAISMASNIPLPQDKTKETTEEDGTEQQDNAEGSDVPLPATLVRIPAEETSKPGGNTQEGQED